MLKKIHQSIKALLRAVVRFVRRAKKITDLRDISQSTEEYVVYGNPILTIDRCGGTLKRVLTLPTVSEMWALDIVMTPETARISDLHLAIMPLQEIDVILAQRVSHHAGSRIVYTESCELAKGEGVVILVTEFNSDTDLSRAVHRILERKALPVLVISVINRTARHWVGSGLCLEIVSLQVIE